MKRKKVFNFLLFFLLTLSFLITPSKVYAGNLTSVSDLLSTSRLSFVGQQSSATPVGGTDVHLDTSGEAPSNSTANLFPGDTLWIGDNGTATDYTLDDIIDTNELLLSSTLDSGDDDQWDYVVATRSASHTVSLTTASPVSNGSFKILVKATTSGSESPNDGIPDQNGFDFGTGTDPTVTCSLSSGSGTYTWGTETAEAYGSGSCTGNGGYHCFTCPYTGDGDASDQIQITIDNLINPAAATDHTAGDADDYIVDVQHLSSSDSIVDSTKVRVAVVESVRVTATVEPTITFTISQLTSANISTNDTCGLNSNFANNNEVTTTATTVPFGSLSLGAFNDAAHELKCVTNGSGGYAVTVIEDDQLSIGGDGSTVIADTDGDDEGIVETSGSLAADEWATENDESGFGFSLDNQTGNASSSPASEVAFEYDGDCAEGGFSCIGDVDQTNCSGTYCAFAFPSTDDSEDALTIMRNQSKPTGNEYTNICYRLAIAPTQTAGDYENALTYVATATF